MPSVWGTGSEWFWEFLQCVAVVATGVLIYRQLKLQNHAHDVVTFDLLADRWNSPLMLESRLFICQQVTGGENKFPREAVPVAMFFESLGVFVRNGAITKNMVWEMYSFDIEHYWPILKNAVTAYRDDSRDQSHYVNFERLYQSMRRMAASRNAYTGERTQSQQSFYKAEEVFAVNKLLHARAREVSSLGPDEKAPET